MFFPLQFLVTTTSKKFRTAELITLVMHGRVKQQMCETTSGNMDTSPNCDKLTEFQCYV